jgi:hypothetical protein
MVGGWDPSSYGADSTGVPTMPGMTKDLKMAPTSKTPPLSDYNVRIQRFVIDEENAGDIAMLENLWTIGMDPTRDEIVILNNKEFTNEATLVIVVTFLEHKKRKVNWRLGDSAPSLPTAKDVFEEINRKK